MHNLHPPKRSLVYILVLAMLLITSLGGCTPAPAGAPAAATVSDPTDSPVPTSEMVPVEQVTDLPTHAPTSTSEPQLVETSIAVSPEPETLIPSGGGQDDFGILIGEDATFGQAEVQIKRPGHLSRITSPFLAIAYVDPGPDRLVQVDLLGEDGRVLTSKTVRAMEYLGMDGGNMITELAFEIEGLSEVGRLEFSVTDEFGRVKAFNSVDLVLLAMGDTDRNYTPQAQERIIIQYPQANYMVQGNSLLVSGLVRTDSEQPLIMTLIDENGELIGEGTASVVLGPGQAYGLFIGEVPFDVEAPLWVRLSVAIPGGRIPGIEFIKTMEMVISP